ncbi:MAG: ribonuclease HI, partial [Clostridia bacterium]|nr:ribonuclease HI [Clostridia bacterium]
VKQGWIKKWQSNNWYRTKTEKAKNVDLFKRLVAQLDRHQVEFVWVKGHAGHPENERCDYLATTAIKGSNLIEDVITE